MLTFSSLLLGKDGFDPFHEILNTSKDKLVSFRRDKADRVDKIEPPHLEGPTCNERV